MTSAELENFVKIGKLKREVFAAPEYEGLVGSGTRRLVDSTNETLSFESRFDLAYNAAHALALAALRRSGYRSDNRYVVFQALEHSLRIPAATWRVMAACHDRRNRAEYEGVLQVDERLLADLQAAAHAVLQALERGSAK